MLNQETALDKRRVLSEAEINILLAGDYPQHAGGYILSLLMLAADGTFSETDFPQTVDMKQLKNVADYLSRYSQSRGIGVPPVSTAMQAKICVIDEQLAKLKTAINERKPLSEIYSTARELSLLCGAKAPRIASFEQ